MKMHTVNLELAPIRDEFIKKVATMNISNKSDKVSNCGSRINSENLESKSRIITDAYSKQNTA